MAKWNKNRYQRAQTKEIRKLRRDKEIMDLRQQGLTYQEIGERVGISKGMVCKIINQRIQEVSDLTMTSALSIQRELLSKLEDDLADIEENIERANKIIEYDSNGNRLPIMNTSLYEQKRKIIETINKLMNITEAAEKERDSQSGNQGGFASIRMFSTPEEKLLITKDNTSRETKGKNLPDQKTIGGQVIEEYQRNLGMTSEQDFLSRIEEVYEFEKRRDEENTINNTDEENN